MTSDGLSTKLRRATPRAHGWFRWSDVTRSPTPPGGAGRHHRLSGAPFVLFVAVAVVTTVGIARVHAQTRVLELGAEISRLTDEQTHLLELKRRLEAERAYLRHPDQVREAAVERLGMVPVTPENVQRIDLGEGGAS